MGAPRAPTWTAVDRSLVICADIRGIGPDHGLAPVAAACSPVAPARLSSRATRSVGRDLFPGRRRHTLENAYLGKRQPASRSHSPVTPNARSCSRRVHGYGTSRGSPQSPTAGRSRSSGRSRCARVRVVARPGFGHRIEPLATSRRRRAVYVDALSISLERTRDRRARSRPRNAGPGRGLQTLGLGPTAGDEDLARCPLVRLLGRGDRRAAHAGHRQREHPGAGRAVGARQRQEGKTQKMKTWRRSRRQGGAQVVVGQDHVVRVLPPAPRSVATYCSREFQGCQDTARKRVRPCDRCRLPAACSFTPRHAASRPHRHQ